MSKNTKKNTQPQNVAPVAPATVAPVPPAKTPTPRLSVAALAQNGQKPALLRTITDSGIAIWSPARIIDGSLYALDSTHATKEAAVARQDALRAEGKSAQAYSSARAKFTEKDGTYTPALAAVYALPFRGAKGHLEGDNLVFEAAPERATSSRAPSGPPQFVVSVNGKTFAVNKTLEAARKAAVRAAKLGEVTIVNQTDGTQHPLTA